MRVNRVVQEHRTTILAKVQTRTLHSRVQHTNHFRLQYRQIVWRLNTQHFFTKCEEKEGRGRGRGHIFCKEALSVRSPKIHLHCRLLGHHVSHKIIPWPSMINILLKFDNSTFQVCRTSQFSKNSTTKESEKETHRRQDVDSKFPNKS